MRRWFTSGRLRGRGWQGALPRLVTAVLGVLLLAVAVVSTLQAGREAAQDDLDHALNGQAASSVSAVQEYFERAQSLDLLLSNDLAFRQFEPGRGGQVKHPVPVTSTEASRALAYLEELYPGRISEACLIDATGTELARVVRGAVAHEHDLSTEEAKNPFFAPTMGLPQGRVYQAAPYVSPDTGEWVISNSTPMVTASGTTWGLVHFEVTVDSFRAAALQGGLEQGFTAAIVDNRTGQVLLEGDRAPDGEQLGRRASPALRALIARQTTGSATVDGQRVAIAPVPAQQDNANAWSIVVSSPNSVSGWSRAVGPAPVAIALAAMLLLAFAGLNLRASHRELERASLTDELTGLPNRRLLADRLDQALLLARRQGTTCAVLLIDLDRFKEVNDTLGHHYGDELLRDVASRLSSAVRASDTVARLGGDEFAVLLPEVDGTDGALVLAHRCLAVLHQAFTVEGVALNVEASIGLALAPAHGSDGDAVLRAADVAMYDAKDHKYGVVVYDPDLDVNTPTRLALLGELRRALLNDELILHYQPKLDLDTDTVHSAEALVRWQHPQRGLLPPSEFLSIAEGTGLILPLTLRTLELAISQASDWHQAGQALQVAVNLSPRCLLENDLPIAVQQLLDRHGLPPRLLRLEITESSIMADPTRALAILTSLQALGVALSLDDFGTGYSSMSYLKRLPVDELKIDRSFITDMLASGSDGVLVRSSIDLGHNLGLSVVAEGVEDPKTLTELAALGCDVVQGYHLARPMPPAALSQWLHDRAALRPCLPPATATV